MAELALELSERIIKAFRRKYNGSSIWGESLASVRKRLDAGEATFRDADMYAVDVGQMLAESMKEVLILEQLPDNRLYYDLAREVIDQPLQQSYGLVTSVAKEIQEEMYESMGVGLQPIQPVLQSKRVDGFARHIAEVVDQDKLNTIFEKGLENILLGGVDDTVRENAKFQDSAGLRVRVKRIYDGIGVHNRSDACEWCLARQGVFDYQDALSRGVFQRHEGCHCIIEYTSEKKGITTRSYDRFGGWTVM